MNYSGIFSEIISITHHDYAGCDDKKGWDNPIYYFEKVESLEREEGLPPQKFVDIVNDYLADFQDPHMYFLLTGNEIKAYTCGFGVRRYKNVLYVTEISKETRLTEGTQILSIDGVNIEELSEKENRRLWEPHPERENWNAILNRSSTIEVLQDNGRTTTFTLNMYESSPGKAAYTIESINDHTLL